MAILDREGPHRNYRIAEDVVMTTWEGEAFVADLRTGRTVVLDDVGSAILSEVRKGKDTEKIIDALLDRYAVDRQTLETDMLEFLMDLEARGFVTIRT